MAVFLRGAGFGMRRSGAEAESSVKYPDFLGYMGTVLAWLIAVGMGPHD